MKLIDALRNVDRRDDNSTWVDMEDIYNALGIDPWQCERPADADNRIKEYWLVKWNCTDTWVGTTAIFFDGELVCMTKQGARKSSKDYTFLSQEAAEKVWEYLKPNKPKGDGFINPDEEIGEHYSVAYVSQVLQDEGFYEGMPATICRDELYLRNRRSYNVDSDGQDITIQFHDGSRKQIHVSEFQFALSLAKEPQA